MLFLTPPKLETALTKAFSDKLESSPLFGILSNLTTVLNEDDDKKEILVDDDLLKFLNSTPQEQKHMLGVKQFIPKKCSRNILQNIDQN